MLTRHTSVFINQSTPELGNGGGFKRGFDLFKRFKVSSGPPNAGSGRQFLREAEVELD